ncbi:MAG TPA: Hsp20/alpha crystallin family protein [Chloroflexota bacterium]|nr:Hsp20/alpha crystallin family protein [Chloroflexota bacterium]
MAIAEPPTAKPVEKTESSRPLAARRWEPTDLFESLQDEIERLWNATRPFRLGTRELFPVRIPADFAAWAPRADVFEKDGALIVEVELPGMDRDSISVTLDGGDLLISGERKSAGEVKEGDYVRCERSHGSFFRRIALPFEVDSERVEATYIDGVLRVKVPKPETARSRTVKIAVK